MLRARAARPAVALVSLALAAWIVAVVRMRGMDMGPGTDLGSFPFFLGLWVTMMAAMMLPSALPMVLLVDRVAHRGSDTALFAGAYVIVWAALGGVAFLLDRGLEAAELGFLAWERQGPLVAGAAVAAAGLYELTPLKRTCLRHCRGPLDYVLGAWRPGSRGALAMGLEHGAYCVGCCWALMLILFAVGVMSLAWMAIVAALVFAQKALPYGVRAHRVLAAGLVALGLWIAAAPGSVPGLTAPM